MVSASKIGFSNDTKDFSSSFLSINGSFRSTDEGFYEVSPIPDIFSPKRSRPLVSQPSFNEIHLSLLGDVAANFRCARNSSTRSKNLEKLLVLLRRPLGQQGFGIPSSYDVVAQQSSEDESKDLLFHSQNEDDHNWDSDSSNEGLVWGQPHVITCVSNFVPAVAQLWIRPKHWHQVRPL
jgi:hypothetical protein